MSSKPPVVQGYPVFSKSEIDMLDRLVCNVPVQSTLQNRAKGEQVIRDLERLRAKIMRLPVEPAVPAAPNLPKDQK